MSEFLRKQMNLLIKDYPIDSIVPMQELPLTGTAFFPGGDGLYKEMQSSITRIPKILVLGQDYDNEINFGKVKNRPDQSELGNKNTTWVNLLKLFGEERVGECFFSNVIMGLRKGDSKNTGPSKAFAKSNSMFFEQNIAFFFEQLKHLKPKGIVCLGIQVPVFLGACFPEQFTKLKTVRSFSELDTLYPEGGANLLFEGKTIPLIFLTHPALFYANAARRKGVEWELNLLSTLVQG